MNHHNIRKEILRQREQHIKNDIAPTQVYMSEECIKKLCRELPIYFGGPSNWKEFIGSSIYGLKIFQDDDFDLHVTGKIQTI